MLAIENNSTAMYFDFKDEENISTRQFTVDRYIQIPKKERLTTAKDGLNNITFTCSRLGRQETRLENFNWVDLGAFSVV